MKLVLDSNIFIAAFLAKGLASDILKLGQLGKLQIYSSEDILDEVKKKLIKKAKLDRKYVKDFISHIKKSVSIVKPSQKLKVIKKDPDDNKILECAVEANADLIISMDKHLLRLKSYKTAGIIHPKTLTWIIPQLFK